MDSAFPSGRSNILCSRKCATPAGVSILLPSRLKRRIAPPYFVAKKAKPFAYPGLEQISSRSPLGSTELYSVSPIEG